MRKILEAHPSSGLGILYYLSVEYELCYCFHLRLFILQDVKGIDVADRCGGL